jgi:hypothetical protein
MRTDGAAAKYIHVLCCLNAASLRRFPWVSRVFLRKCKPLTKRTETQSTEESLGKVVKLYIKLMRLGNEIVYKIGKVMDFIIVKGYVMDGR